MARPIGRQQALDQLGDLFFGATGARPPASAGLPAGCSAGGASGRTPPPSRAPSPGVDDLLARPLETPQIDMPASVAPTGPAAVAILTGGVPPQRRLLLAREAVSRLMAPCGLTALVTFDGPRATVAALARDDVQAATSCQACGHFGDIIRAADRLILVLADAASEFIASGGSLPDHCVVLTLADPQWLVEAYRELKAATTATKGPVPDIFVLEADARDEAERTFRRLSRVAIAHLGCSPTFLGHTVGRGGTAAPVPVRGVFDSLEARAVFGYLRPLLRARSGDMPGTDRGDVEPASRPPRIQHVTVRPAEPQAGQRQTLPPVAGVVETEFGGGSPAFAAWQPASRDELLEAVAASLGSVIPGLRGTIDLRADLAADAEGPDLVAVDRDGAAVAVLVAEDGNPAALVRAERCRRWLASHVRLLRRAYGDAGLAAEDRPVGCIVLAADEQAATFRGLRPQNVRVATYLPLQCGAVHGLLLRESTDETDTVIGTVCQRVSASAVSALGAAPPSPERTAAVSTPGAPPAEPTRAAAAPADLEPPALRGTSPDDDLSADELSDLRNGFEIDELT